MVHTSEPLPASTGSKRLEQGLVMESHKTRRHRVPWCGAHLHALSTSAATLSMSSALSFVNGRGMSSREITFLPLTTISKAPFRGFSALMLQEATPLTAASIFVARVLNAFQDLQASMLTTVLPLPVLLAGAGALAFFTIVFFGIFVEKELRVRCVCALRGENG